MLKLHNYIGLDRRIETSRPKCYMCHGRVEVDRTIVNSIHRALLYSIASNWNVCSKFITLNQSYVTSFSCSTWNSNFPIIKVLLLKISCSVNIMKCLCHHLIPFSLRNCVLPPKPQSSTKSNISQLLTTLSPFRDTVT